MDLNTFIVAVFCLVEIASTTSGGSGRADPPPRSPTRRSSPSRSSASSWGWIRIPRSSGTSAATTPTSSRDSRGCTAPPSSVRPPTSGRPRSASGNSSWPSHPTTPPSPSATRCPCRRACSPAPTVAVDSAGRPPGGRVRQRHPPQADLLWFQDAREGGVARSHHALLGGSG